MDALTANASAEDKKWCEHNIAIDEVATKPFRKSNLGACIRGILVADRRYPLIRVYSTQ